MVESFGNAPDAAAIERLAHIAMQRIPLRFREYLTDVIVQVEEFADDETLREMEVEDPWHLTGLYHGHPIGERSIWESGELPPKIILYRCPILSEWIETGVTLEDLVSHVVVHEVGHHFGLSDAEMHDIENGAS